MTGEMDRERRVPWARDDREPGADRSEELGTTEALCPECLAVLDARIYSDEEGRVWMGRTCPEHGPLDTFIWPDVDHYKWMRSLAFPYARPMASALRPVDKPCPTDCGMCARHLRKPTLVEIEVTQSCNLRCPVCFMSAEVDPYAISLEQIDSMYDAIAEQAGIQTGVQITGGEPTTRADLPEIVRIGRDKGFWGIEVNTNGVVISRNLEYLQKVVDAGCTGIYLQFDGLTSETYERIRGLDRPYKVRLCVYYDRKSNVTLFDAEIAGQRTMICRRPGRFSPVEKEYNTGNRPFARN